MKNLFLLFTLSFFLSGCQTYITCLPDCLPSAFENVVTVRFQVVDKGSGLPVKDAAIDLGIVRIYFEKNPGPACCEDYWVQKVIGATDDNGYCEITFTASYKVTNDYYRLDYSIHKQGFETGKGIEHINRDAEYTIEVRLLSNTTQP